VDPLETYVACLDPWAVWLTLLPLPSNSGKTLNCHTFFSVTLLLTGIVLYVSSSLLSCILTPKSSLGSQCSRPQGNFFPPIRLSARLVSTLTAVSYSLPDGTTVIAAMVGRALFLIRCDFIDSPSPSPADLKKVLLLLLSQVPAHSSTSRTGNKPFTQRSCRSSGFFFQTIPL